MKRPAPHPFLQALAGLLPPALRRRALQKRRSSLSSASAARLQRLRRARPGATSSLDDEPLPFWATVSWPRVGLAAGTAALLSLLLCIHLWPNRVSLRRGDLAEQDIVAPRTVRYEDGDATARMRADAAAQVGKQYDVIPEALTGSVGAAGAVFDAVERWANAPVPSPAPAAAPAPSASGSPAVKPAPPVSAVAEAERALRIRADGAERDIRRAGDVSVPRAALIALLRQGPQGRAEAKAAALGLIERYMARGITDDGDDLALSKRALGSDPDLAKVGAPDVRGAVSRIAAGALMPTRRYDPRETAREQQARQGQVAPVIRTAIAGQPIVRAGQQVTQQHLDAFTALGLQSARLDAGTVATVAGLVCGVLALAAVYLRLFHRALYDDTPRMLLLSILVLLSVTGLKAGQLLLGLPLSGVHFGYLGMMCVASAGMAIALLLRPSVALLAVSLLAVASGLILNNELRFTLITLGSSLVGIVSVATLRNRGDFLRATLVLCGANAVLNVLVGLLEGDPARELLSGAVWGAVSGVFALALFYTGVAVFERWFGITTHLRLLELSDPATPVLQEFRMRVPGTYAHSLMVGNLAHAAAEAVGADALLVRVAAYYHDLGKMNRPDFFIENQSGVENVHDRISPSLSALVLASHVKEGIEMGQAVGLPPRVLEVIQQHHGTQLMKFFYYRATGGSGDPSLEPQFRYAGPKPQTREAAILMLADGVEAASRTLEKPTPQRIADFVKRMVDDKLQDGQLDECDLTLRDLRTIQDVFSRTLSGTLHARISYPDDKKPSGGPPTLTAPTLTLATFPEEALSGALRVTPPDGAAAPGEPTAPGEHTGAGNGTHRTNRAGGGPEGASLAFTRGGRRHKASGGGG